MKSHNHTCEVRVEYGALGASPASLLLRTSEDELIDVRTGETMGLLEG